MVVVIETVVVELALGEQHPLLLQQSGPAFVHLRHMVFTPVTEAVVHAQRHQFDVSMLLRGEGVVGSCVSWSSSLP